MKDLLAKEQFIDAILDGDARLRLNAKGNFLFEACIVGQQKGVQLMSLIAGNLCRMMYLHKLKVCSLKWYPPKVSGPRMCWACARRGYLKRDRWKVRKNKSRDMQNQNFPSLI